MLFSLIKKSFVNVAITPAITLFLVLYFIVISVLMAIIGTQSNAIIGYILVLTSFLFVAIFLSGWYRIIKEIALNNSAYNSNEENKRNLIADFLESIGQNVVPYMIALSIYFFCSVLFAYAAYMISIKYFGNPQELILKAQASENAIEYINNLPQEEMIKLYAIPISFMISFGSCMFLFLYYFPAIIFSQINNIFLKPFIALKDNFVFLFKHFFQSAFIFILLCIINTAVVFIKRACLPEHVVFDILYLFYVIYFLSFAIMLICSYYGKNCSCDNGADCLGENESNDNSGKEN